MKIYTKTGDDGTTSLFDGTRVKKDDERVACYGDVDELNAFLGVVASSGLKDDHKNLLQTIQRDLFALAANLANPAHKKQKAKADFHDDKIKFLENAIDTAESEIDPIKFFMIPGGDLKSAYLDYARTVCRRAERHIVTLSQTEPVDMALLIYLNRLSDLLFMLARVANKRAGIADIPWK